MGQRLDAQRGGMPAIPCDGAPPLSVTILATLRPRDVLSSAQLESRC